MRERHHWVHEVCTVACQVLHLCGCPVAPAPQLHQHPIPFWAQFKVLVLTYKALNSPCYLENLIFLYDPTWMLRWSGETFLSPNTFTVAFGGDTEEVLLLLPDFGTLSHTMPDWPHLFLQARFPFKAGWLSGVFKWMVVPYCLECVFGVAFVFHLLVWHF